jgi:hypothetical protein
VLALLVVEALDGQVQVRTVKALHDHLRIAHAEQLEDLLAHGRGGGGGEREHRRMAERLDRRADAQVVGAEVVAPLRDGVRLVHHEQRDAAIAQPRQHVLVRELLGSEQDVLDFLLRHILQQLLASAVGERRVERRRLHAFCTILDRIHLVLLERDERRDDDRRPVDQHPGELVDRRLAGTGRHDAERVAPGRHRLDCLRLPGAQRVEAEPLAREAQDLVAGGNPLSVPAARRPHHMRAVARTG